MSITEETKSKKRRRNKKRHRNDIISFDEETIKKDDAEKVLQRAPVKQDDKSNNSEFLENELQGTQVGESDNINKKKAKKRGQKKPKRKLDESMEDDTVKEVKSPKKPKRNKIQQEVKDAVDNNDVQDNSEEVKEESTTKEKGESIRAMKRKKHAKLIEEKKLKTELSLQQKALNYLSKWKHSRSEWKFEKLRQIWLQQSMFDTSKVPEEFWDTLVEYLSNTKGKAREVILKEALKIIEKEEVNETEDPDESNEDKIKIKRARDIIQYLQE